MACGAVTASFSSLPASFMVLPRMALETAASIINSAKWRVALSSATMAWLIAFKSLPCLTKTSRSRATAMAACSSALNSFHAGFCGRLRNGGKNRIGFVARFDEQASRKILFGVVEGIENHVLDLLVGQSIRRLHLDLRGLSAALLARGDVQDAIGIDKKTHLDARQPRRHGRNAFQVESRQGAAIGGQFALALHHVNGDIGLAVDASGEVLGGRGRNGGVALDDARHRSAQRLNAERKRRHIEQQHVVGGF